MGDCTNPPIKPFQKSSTLALSLSLCLLPQENISNHPRKSIYVFQEQLPHNTEAGTAIAQPFLREVEHDMHVVYFVEEFKAQLRAVLEGSARLPAFGSPAGTFSAPASAPASRAPRRQGDSSM